MQTLPTQLYQAQQVRQLDAIAINEFGIAGIELMHRAAQAVWQQIQQRYSPLRSISVFCGAGNNGGDGYLVATLALQAGLDVIVYNLTEAEKLSGDALTAYQIYQQQGGCVQAFSLPLLKTDVIVDALLGTGLSRAVSSDYAQAVQAINDSGCAVIAVDIPSGLNADTGCVMGCAVKADVTVTLIALKQGLFTADARDCCGEMVLADLAVPNDVFNTVTPSANRIEPMRLPPRPRNSHKGQFGHVLIVGGAAGFSGAARLAGEAALRTGAGLVSVVTHVSHAAFLNIGRFELMCHGVENAAQLQALVEKADVIALGMGLGQQVWGYELFHASISQAKPLVLDADGLNWLVQTQHYRDDWILTPHPGEAARLLGCRTQEINADRFAAVKQLQNRYGGVCVLKGAGTLIFDGTELFVADNGNPGMATAGMGDVLAGVISSLIAQGFALMPAAKLGVHLHGKAGDLAALEHGERGLLAGDLMDYLTKVVN